MIFRLRFPTKRLQFPVAYLRHEILPIDQCLLAQCRGTGCAPESLEDGSKAWYPGPNMANGCYTPKSIGSKPPFPYYNSYLGVDCGYAPNLENLFRSERIDISGG